MRTAYETNVISKFLPLYGLSKIVPVPMKSCYKVATQLTEDPNGGYEAVYQPECSTWWQWRGRVWKHKVFNNQRGWQ